MDMYKKDRESQFECHTTKTETLLKFNGDLESHTYF